MTRQLLGEFLGTALLLFVIVGSGIVADHLRHHGSGAGTTEGEA